METDRAKRLELFTQLLNSFGIKHEHVDYFSDKVLHGHISEFTAAASEDFKSKGFEVNCYPFSEDWLRIFVKLSS